MAYQSSLNLKLDTRTGEQNLRQFRGELSQTFDQGNKTAIKLREMFTSLSGAFSGLGVGEFVVSTINEMAKLESKMLGLEALIQTTGQTAGFTAEQLKSQADALAVSTLQNTSGVLDAQKVLLSFRRVSGDTFKEALELSADLSTVFGTSLSQSAAQLGKALEDPVQGIQDLNGSGWSFTDVQKDMVRSMVETNRLGEAQAVILEELKSHVGGAAEGEAKGLAGALDVVGQRMEEFGMSLTNALGSEGGMVMNYLDLVAKSVRNLNQALFPDDDLRSAQLWVDIERLNAEIKEMEDGGVPAFRTRIYENKKRELEAAEKEYRAINNRQEEELARQEEARQRSNEEQQRLAEQAAQQRAEAEKKRQQELRDQIEASRVARVANITEQLEAELMSYSASERALLERKLNMEGATEAERKFALATFDSIQKLKEQREASEAADSEIRAFESGLANAVDSLDPLGAEFERVGRLQSLLIGGALKGKISNEYRDKLITNLVEGMAGAGDEYNQWVNNLKESIDPMQKVEQEVANIWAAFEAGDLEGIGRDSVEAYVNKLVNAVDSGANEFIGIWSNAANSIAGSLQSAIVSGEWGNVGDSIGAALGASMNTVINKHITDSLSKNVTSSSGMLAQIGAVTAGPIAGAVVGGVVERVVSDLLSSQQWDPTEERQAAQGTGTVLGAADEKSESIRRGIEHISATNEQLVNISNGMLSALESTLDSIHGAVSMSIKARQGMDFSVADRGAFGLGAETRSAMVAIGPGGVALQKLVGEIPVIGGVFNDLVHTVLGSVDDVTGGLLSGIGNAIFGSKKKVDEGILILGGSIAELTENTVVKAFATIRKSGSLFGGSGYEKDKTEKLATDQFTLIFQSLEESILAGAETLNLVPEEVQGRLDEFVVKTQRISLEGMDSDEQVAAVESVISEVFDTMVTEAVPFVGSLRDLGEGLGETLARVGAQVQLTQEGFDALGVTLSVTDPEQLATYADALVKAAGGIGKFSNSLVAFERAFLTEAEQFDNTFRRLTESLGDLPLPETRQGFADLLKAQLESAVGNEEAVATLLRLVPLADQYYQALEESAAEAARGAEEVRSQLSDLTDSALSDLEASINARRELASQGYQEEQDAIQAQMDARLQANRLALDAAQEGVRAIQQEIQGIESAASGLSKAFQPIQQNRRESALGVLRDALASGDLTGTGDAAAIVGEIDAGNYASRVEYERAQGRSLGLLEALQVEGTQQLTVAEQALAALQHQADLIRQQGQDALDQATQAYEDEIAALDQILLGAEEQINTLRGIETGVLSVADAIANMASALGQEVVSGHNPDDPIATLEQLYRTLLGREIGQEGRSYWSSMLANGATLADVEWGIRHSDEFRNRNSVASLGFAAKELASRKLHIPTSPQPSAAPVLHDYVPAKDRQSSSNSALVREIQQLRAELMAVQEGIALNTSRIANNSDRMETLGVKSRKEELV